MKGKIGKFEKLRSLTKEMKKEEHLVEPFPFFYNNNEYIGIVKLFEEDDERKPYEFILEFIRAENFSEVISCEITFLDLNIKETEIKKFKDFFQVEYIKYGDFFQNFKNNLADSLPDKITNFENKRYQNAILKSVNNYSNEEEKIYCYKCKRNGLNKNGKLKKRTLKNSSKTMMLRPELYRALKEEIYISFCYTADERFKEITDKDILGTLNKTLNID